MGEERLLSLWVYGLMGLILLLAMTLGFVWGSVVDLTIFLLVRPSLPPPWRWLPPFRDYSVPYFSLLGVWIILMLMAWWKISGWKHILAWSCVLAWLTSLISHIVVHGLSGREYPRMEAGELIFTGVFVSSSCVVTNLIICIIIIYIINAIRKILLKFFDF